MADGEGAKFARRDVLKQIATVAGTAQLAPAAVATAATAAAIGAAQAEPAAAPTSAAPTSVPAPLAGYQSLSLDEAAFVEALVNIMCPADHLTPNGVDCGLAVFMDRQLAGGFGQGERLYMHGPWKKGKPQFGYQLPLTPEQFFKVGLAAANAACRKQLGKSFDALAPAQAEAFLTQLAGGKVVDERVPLGAWFNELVYPLFEQACYADPIYGGNNGKVFWRMIGYPGLPATHQRDIVTYRGKPYPGANDPKSIADFS
jgi:gluconate 2-dehydrogenase gamma chain